MPWWRHQMENAPRYWPIVQGNHRSPVNSPDKGQWRGAFMFSLICVWTKSWVNNGDASDLRRHRSNHDVIAMPHRSSFVEYFHMLVPAMHWVAVDSARPLARQCQSKVTKLFIFFNRFHWSQESSYDSFVSIMYQVAVIRMSLYHNSYIDAVYNRCLV